MRAHIIAIADTENTRKARANDRRRFGQHAGLLLQRFFADTMIEPKTGQRRDKRDLDERVALLRAAIAASQDGSLRELYEAAYTRSRGSFPQDKAHLSMQLTTAGRLVVGLGSESVLETGLRLHHTYGVPIIPGSALKGVASHYCHDIWGQRHNEAAPEENRLFQRGGAHHSLLFGTTDDGGVITFHDALITPDSLNNGALRLDVMTPHHPKWQTNEAPPTDFDNPVPVSFLSVSGAFEIRLSWSGPAGTPSDRAEAWTALTMKLLRESLAEWGVGGKTTSGYGRLVPTGLLGSGQQPSVADRVKQVALPKPGETIDARLLEARTRKGGWKAMHEPSGLAGAIQNSGDVPTDKKVGDTLKLAVASANERELAFRFPTPADEERALRAPSKGRARGGSGQGGRRN